MQPVIAWKPIGNIGWPSSRLRAFLPYKYLREVGWSCKIFDPNAIDSYDLVVFQKTYYDAESLPLVKYLRNKGIKTVLDICDNDFYNPNNRPHLQQRSENLQRMIDCVDAVSVSTPEIGKLIQGKEIVVVIDDAIDYPSSNFLTNSYLKLKSFYRNIKDNSFRVVWYGTNRTEPEDPPAGIIDVSTVLPVMEELHTELPLALTIISNSKTLFEKYLSKASFPVKYYEWDSKSFPYLFKQNDVCIIPINLNPFTRCKTNNRLALSLLLGVAVISDKIPSYEEFSDFVLFSEWKNNLRKYALNRELRQQQVKEGRKYILSKYNRDRVIFQWSSLFQKLLNGNHFVDLDKKN
jgi:glycosyltransferase involved in cell wall biosynthesis